MTDKKQFEYSVYPNNNGEGVSFSKGVIHYGDWDHSYNMPPKEVKRLYEALRAYYKE